MRSICAAVAAAISVLACTASASANWSVPQSFSSSGPIGGLDAAVDSRGNAAVAWSKQPPPPGFSHGTAIYVAARLANGKLIRRLVWSSRVDRPAGMSVVIGHGEVTVAWAAATPQQEHSTGEFTVWTAYGPLLGHWARPRPVGHWIARVAPYSRGPRLAVSPSGEVLLTFDDKRAPIGGPAVAWRSPGHAFGALQSLFGRAKVRLTVPRQLRPIPEFDAGGRAYVWGRCDGVVVVTRPHSRSFGRPIVLAPPPVESFTLSLSGRGQGLAAWIRGRCALAQEQGPSGGPVFASVLRKGSFGRPLTVTSAPSGGSAALAERGGGGTVTWSDGQAAFGLPIRSFSAHIGANGTLGSILPAPVSEDVLVPVAYDAAGDAILGQSNRWDYPPPEQDSEAVAGAVAPAGQGAPQPVPVNPREGGRMGVAAFGRAVVRVWSNSSSTLAVSVWRP